MEMPIQDGWRIKRDVKEHYDKLADTYDDLYGEEQKAKIESALNLISSRRFDAAVDVGCGTGLLFNSIKDRSTIIIGVDISRKLLRRAHEKTRNKSNIMLINADADHLPFKEETFDMIFMITVLQNLPDYISTLKEISRVSRRNGLILLTGLKRSFEKREFYNLLVESGMEILHFIDDENLLDYISVARRK